MVIEDTRRVAPVPVMFTVPIAVTPPPAGAEKVTVGVVLAYDPAPLFVMLTEFTEPVMIAVAAAPLPPPPRKMIVGGVLVYPRPPLLTVKDVTDPEITAVAAAPVPP